MAYDGPNPYDVTAGGTGLPVITAHGVIVGNGTGPVTVISPSATVGTPFCSGGVSANPSYNVSPVVSSITISNSPVNPSDGVNKAYADMIAAGFSFKNTVVAATTANLTATYANGSSGVGATLTNSGALAVFSVDGISPALNSRVLVKNQSSQLQNGIYTLTTVGSGSVAWVLTRSTDYDTVAEITSGSLVPVQSGTVNADTMWLQTQTITTVGTDSIIFNQFVFAPNTFLQVANNLSDVNSASTSRTNLGLTNVAIASVTNHYVLVGASSNGITSVAPSATSGIPLISQGTSADPVFGTATVPGGGTGVVSNTAYAVICGGTTSTGALQSVASVGSSGQVLTSNGPGALPSFQAAATGGAMVLLSTQTASNSSAVNFTTGISATYNKYIVMFHNVTAATSQTNLQMQVSSNGGSSYVNTGYNASSYAANGSAGVAGANITTAFLLSASGVNGFPSNASFGMGTIEMYDFTNGGTPTITGRSCNPQQNGSNTPLVTGFSGFGPSATTVNAIRFLMSSGNITTGTFSLYGVTQ